MPSMPALVPRDLFRRACARFATGITVVTTADAAGDPQGMTANSFTSVSLEPPLLLVCVDRRNRMLDCLSRGASFAVNVLSEEQQPLSDRFAFHPEDRFAGLIWRAAGNGAPLLDGAMAWFACQVTETVEAGDHVIVVGEVLDAAWQDGRPLLYYDSGYRKLADG